MHRVLRLVNCLLLAPAILAANQRGSYDGVGGVIHDGVATPSSRSPGCFKHLLYNITLGQSTNVSIASGGLNRSYLIHVPETYRAYRPTPLILSYHGRTRSAKEQEDLSQFSNTTYNKYAIAVYPQGEMSPKGTRQWQGDPEASPSVDDVAFTSDLITALTSQYCIDRNRIYAAGKSNGAGLVGILACDPGISSKIAAFAPVSGAFYLDENGQLPPCNPSRSPVPIVEFHGFKDATVSYNGGARGDRGETISIPDWVEGWEERNGCVTRKNETKYLCGASKRTIRYSWDCEGIQDAVVHYNISNLGHDWPSTFPNGDGNLTSCFDATTKIMEFFGEHTLDE